MSSLFVALALVIGCSSGLRHYTNSPALEGIRRVAVIPFHNLTRDPVAGEVVTRIFLTELIRGRMFIVVEMGDVEDFMFQQRVKRKDFMNRTVLNLLRSRTGAEAAIMGTVNRFDYVGRVPVVSLTVRMVDTEDGHIIWKASAERNGDDYLKVLNLGKIRSLPRLCQVMAREMIATMGR